MQDSQQRRARRSKRTTASGEDAEANVYVNDSMPNLPPPRMLAVPPPSAGPKVWLQLEGAVSGQLTFELDASRCVNAAANFMFLAEADEGAFNNRQAFLGDKALPNPLPGSSFSCVVKNEVAEFGTSNTTSYWGGFFKDEGLQRQVKGTTKFSNANLGALSMSNAGPDTNASRFFITLNPGGMKDLDAYHVCFGQLVDGFDVLERLNNVATDPKRGNVPKNSVFIAGSGIVDPLAMFSAQRDGTAQQNSREVIGSRRGRDPDDDLSGSLPEQEFGNRALLKSAKRRRGEVLNHDPRFAGELQPVAIESGANSGFVKPSAEDAVKSMQRVFEHDLLEIQEIQKYKKGAQRLKADKNNRVASKFEARSRSGTVLKPQQKMRYK